MSLKLSNKNRKKIVPLPDVTEKQAGAVSINNFLILSTVAFILLIII